MAPRKSIGNLKKKEKEASSLSLQINQKNSEIKRLKAKLAHKESRIASLKQSIGSIECPQMQPPIIISNSITSNRLKNPSTPSTHSKLKQRRSKETFDLCAKIHGGTDENIQPTIDGMWETLQRKVPANLFVHKVRNFVF